LRADVVNDPLRTEGVFLVVDCPQLAQLIGQDRWIKTAGSTGLFVLPRRRRDFPTHGVGGVKSSQFGMAELGCRADWEA
jgi:hypothetical protein